jgi:hypothetical protein
MMLQLLGLFTVAVGLSQIRRLFGRPSLIAKVTAWFGRLASTFGPPRTISMHASAGGFAIVGGEARLIRGVGPDASLERRIAVLEENLNLLRDETDSRVQELRKGLVSIKERAARETQERETEDKKTAKKIGLVSRICG